MKGIGGAMKERGKKGHFALEELADLARNIGSADRLKAMKQHVADCRKCARASETWQRVARAAHRLPASEPPAGTVRIAKALYSTHEPRKARGPKSLVAQLLFDSSIAPAQAGVRSSTANPRQLLFGSGEYRVDLRIEPQDDADTVALLGQILHASNPGKNLGAVAVSLNEGRRVLAQSQTNCLGEFQLECDLKPTLELRLMLPDMQLAIPLVEPLRDASKKNLYLLGTTVFKDFGKGKQGKRRE
ncbi:MAG: hypothetical protein ACRD8A_15600 [Candidatus Acidiferrales bacterium]